MNQTFLSVTELTKAIKERIDSSPFLQQVWLRAEISNFKHHSRGHMYFTLKDNGSRIQSVMFAGSNRYLNFTPENGMSVLVRGEVSVYEPYGQYQLYVKELQPDGIGNLYLAFEELKKKLEKEGLFDQQLKKKIPRTPRKIAVITSPTGAAVRDILTTLKRRYPVAKTTLLPVQVQGDAAKTSIVKAIQQADATDEFDVMIVGRGGGSIEELWAFNEEIVARAIFEAMTPVISAVGHETDTTISDFVADMRAPTPTAAAELAVPNQQEMMDWLMDRNHRLRQSIMHRISQEKERLNRLQRSYAFRYPKQLVEQKEQDLDRLIDDFLRSAFQSVGDKRNLLQQLRDRLQIQHPERKLIMEQERLFREEKRLKDAMSHQLSSHQQQLMLMTSKLDLLSPLKLMSRGYSLVYNEKDKLVKQLDHVAIKDKVTIHMMDGKLSCEVVNKTKLNREQEDLR